MSELTTPAGMVVRRFAEEVDPASAIDGVLDDLDTYPGALLSAQIEYPGRYTRRSRGFSRPPLAIHGRGRTLRFEALSERGTVPLRAVADILLGTEGIRVDDSTDRTLTCTAEAAAGRFPEEQRSKQNSVFTAVRALAAAFAVPEDPYLGLYGAFGYDLVFQFEDIQRRPRDPGQRDLVLYLPDRLVVVDGAANRAVRYRYELTYAGRATDGLDDTVAGSAFVPTTGVAARRDHAPGEFASVVEQAKESFRRGDLFEVVPGQTFFAPCPTPPSTIFRRLGAANPAPFAALVNLGEREYLVSGSPEMYLRVAGRRVESCPISGTVRRGGDAFGDARMIRTLLNSAKDEAELTMCTDVDRNDKARVCEPGSVRVIGRRQIEVYSKVIHTVDHVEGRLRDGYDAIDAFLSHMWAVTVTGAPKLWAMRFIEEHERGSRAWYGGAIGFVGFDGTLDTGLTLRTIRVLAGVAEVRAGGTLLIDSDPAEEERESELKASAFLEVLDGPPAPAAAGFAPPPVADPPRVLLLDCEDSFVHTLADYVRQTSAEVLTLRAPLARADLESYVDSYRPSLLLLSPGPGRPERFGLSSAIETAIRSDCAVWGVCLGLQGIVEYFGGRLDQLPYPMHGRPSTVRHTGGRLLAALPPTFLAGRYHSLHAVRAAVPPELDVTAVSDDGIVMAVEHRTLPIAAVQFHPESIMSTEDDVGLRIVHAAVTGLAGRRRATTAATSGRG